MRRFSLLIRNRLVYCDFYGTFFNMRTTTTVRQIIDQVDTPESLWDRAELIHYARKFLRGYHNYYVVRRNRAAKQYAAEQELAAKKQQQQLPAPQQTSESFVEAVVSDGSCDNADCQAPSTQCA